MDIAITGSSGLIGIALTERLTAAGHTVRRVLRRDGGPGTVRWDPVAGTIDAAALEGVDAVIHLAGEGIGEKRWTPAQKDVIRSSRTLGTGLIARTIAELATPPKVLLSGSAIGWYGDRGDTGLDESEPAGTDYLASVVVDWEAAARPAVDAGIRTVLLRTGIVLSPDGGALKRQLPVFRAGLGGRFGSGQQYQSWISITDEVRAIEWLLTSDLSGPVNLTAPEPVTNATFTKRLGAALHRPTFIVPMAGPRILFGRELADSLLLTSQKVLPVALERHGFAFQHPTLDAALRDLLHLPS